MRYKVIAVVVLAFFVLSVAAMAGEVSKSKLKRPPVKSRKVVSAVCPVMGTKISDVSKAAGKSVYKGKTYYFCCPGCKPLFDKNPGKYIKKTKPAKKAAPPARKPTKK
jgi:YHS domain-containing protein